MFNLTTNYFRLFGLAANYQLDLVDLKTRYLELQRQVHPDQFASESDQVQRQAMQSVSYLNQAYETLKSPLKRAVYLLQTAGQDFDPDTQVHNDPVFLMEQMELREELSAVSDADDAFDTLECLRDKASTSYKQYQESFADLYAEENWPAASTEINKMMFATKMLQEISEKEETLF